MTTTNNERMIRLATREEVYDAGRPIEELTHEILATNRIIIMEKEVRVPAIITAETIRNNDKEQTLGLFYIEWFVIPETDGTYTLVSLGQLRTFKLKTLEQIIEYATCDKITKAVFLTKKQARVEITLR